MILHKSPRLPEHNFVMVPNSFVRNPDLPRDAKALLIELMSHTDGWVLTIERLESDHERRTKLRRMIKDLMDARYMVRVQTRGPNGRFDGNSVMIDFEPIPQELVDRFHESHGVVPSEAAPMSGNPTSAPDPHKKTTSSEDQRRENNNNRSGEEIDHRGEIGEGWWPERGDRDRVQEGWTPNQLFREFAAATRSGPGLMGYAELVHYLTTFWRPDELEAVLEELRNFPDCRYPVKWFCSRLGVASVPQTLDGAPPPGEQMPREITQDMERRILMSGGYGGSDE